MTLFTITFIAIVSLVLLLVNSSIIFLICRFFNVNNVSYIRSILITILYAFASMFVYLIIYFFIRNIYASILTLGIVYLFFNIYFRKFHQTTRKKSLLIYIINIILSILISTAIVIPIRAFVFEPFVVSGKAMIPNFNEGDYLIIKKFGNNYKRNDVIVYMSRFGTYFIHRIVATPLEKVKISDGQLYINGLLIVDKYLSTPIPTELVIDLKEGEYFVLGDNSAGSLDSKTLGPINIKDIVGKVIIR